jgi:hypothetical protein
MFGDGKARAWWTAMLLAGWPIACTEPHPCFAPPYPPGCPGSVMGGSGGEIPPDLVAWYRFEESAAEVGGAIDSSGNGLDAQCSQTCPGSTAGVDGQALFNDDRGFLTMAAADELAFDAFTLMAWIRDDSAAGDSTTNMFLCKPYLASGENSFRLHTRDSDDDGARELSFRLDGETVRDQIIRYPVADRLGTWMHVAATWDGQTMALFLDGAQVGTLAAPVIAYDEQPLVIGADLNAFESDNFWEGAIDEVEIHRRVLGADEIAERGQ